MERFCKDCAHYTDAKYNRVYVTPRCTAHGGDDAGFFRQYVCGIDEARLWQPRPETREGTEHADTQAKAVSCQHSNGQDTRHNARSDTTATRQGMDGTKGAPTTG